MYVEIKYGTNYLNTWLIIIIIYNHNNSFKSVILCKCGILHEICRIYNYNSIIFSSFNISVFVNNS